jgi:hypothetical protein
MRFSHTSSYDAPPAAVYEMLTDPAFRGKVCAFVKSPSHEVSVSASPGAVSVTIDQTQRVRKVPAFAAKMVGETIQIVQVERWTTPTAADLELTIPGKPGHLRGLIALDPSATGTTHTVTGELKVGIPLVGGKLEGLIEGLLTMLMNAEQDVGRAWLAGER